MIGWHSGAGCSVQPAELPKALFPSSQQDTPTVQLRRGLISIALVLLCAGILLQFSELNRAWMVAVHMQPISQDVVWLFLTNLGRGWPAFAILAALDLGSGKRSALFFRCFLLSALLLPLMKKFFSVARPVSVMGPDALHLMGVPVTGMSSMPSGHALTAGAVLGILWLTSNHPNSKHRFDFTSWAGLFIALLVAFSRIVIGAHWPADVVIGFGIGLLMACAAGWHEQRKPWASSLSKGYWVWAILVLQFVCPGIMFWSAAENPLEVVPNLLLGIGAALLAIISLRRHYLNTVLFKQVGDSH